MDKFLKVLLFAFIILCLILIPCFLYLGNHMAFDFFGHYANLGISLFLIFEIWGLSSNSSGKSDDHK